MAIVAEIASYHEDMVRWRQDLHRHPELAYQEHRTAGIVAELLAGWGIAVTSGLAGTGVVGTLLGRRGPSARAVGLRADMDALPLQELADRPHRSTVSGRMHACGHDGHVATLLGAARYLAQTRDFAGTVHFVFQPAEESAAGGLRLVEAGLFERFPMEAIYGLHNWPGLPVGSVAVWPGPIMGAYDLFEVTVQGQGAHGSQPHLGVDALGTAAQIVTGLQTLTSRRVDPLDAAVVAVTTLQAGESWNILPATALLRGGARALRPEVQDLLEAGVRRIAQGIAAAAGATAEVEYRRFCPPVVNGEAEAALVREAATRVVGAARVLTSGRPSLAAEDFAYLLAQRPGCFFWLGNGPAEGGRNLHSPYYDFDDAILPLGASCFVRIVEQALAPA